MADPSPPSQKVSGWLQTVATDPPAAASARLGALLRELAASPKAYPPHICAIAFNYATSAACDDDDDAPQALLTALLERLAVLAPTARSFDPYLDIMPRPLPGKSPRLSEADPRALVLLPALAPVLPGHVRQH